VSLPWPGPDNPLRSASYELVIGFDPHGQPVYARGSVQDDDTLEALQNMLAALEPTPASITSVTMGTLELVLESGARLSLRPVFRPSTGVYEGLLKVDRYDVPMPDALAALLNGWRRELAGG